MPLTPLFFTTDSTDFYGYFFSPSRDDALISSKPDKCLRLFLAKTLRTTLFESNGL